MRLDASSLVMTHIFISVYDFSYKNNSYKSTGCAGVPSNNGDVLKSFTKEYYTNFIKETNNNNNNNNNNNQ